jgi:hypothetical protein
VTSTQAFILTLATLTMATLAQPGPAAAGRYRLPGAPDVRIAYSEDAAMPPPFCRLGWWQTLRDGHVRPQWGLRCR